MSGKLTPSEPEHQLIFDEFGSWIAFNRNGVITFLPATGYDDNVVAGGGTGSITQAGATTLNYRNTRVTSAALNTSVVLPFAQPGMRLTLFNTTANVVRVFPASGEVINIQAADTSFNLNSNTSNNMACIQAGIWRTSILL